jgi:Bifunctional DNA primase/polymerase, N-terminal/Primase C terminal 1 (PriCT-1)
MTAQLDAALAWAERGVPAFPVRPGGKEPMVPGGFRSATCDPDTIRSWWSKWSDANVALACGDGLTVLDVDGPEGMAALTELLRAAGCKLGRVPRADTPHGRHYYFGRTDLGRRIGVRPQLDVLGHGGYVIAPPSTGPDGTPYRWHREPNGVLPTMPAALRDLLAGAPRRARDDLYNGAAIPEGTRDATLTSLAGTMRRPGMSASEIEAALLVVNSNRCDPPLPSEQVRKIAQSVARYEPEPAVVHGAVSVLSAETNPGRHLTALSTLTAQSQERWPTLDPAAFYGLAGDVVRTLEPHTEADPAGLLLCLLAMFGNAVGPGPHMIAEAAEHPARLHVVLVGDTARSRKGSAHANIARILAPVDPEWFANHLPGGLASGEGLIAAVDDNQAIDGRLLVLDPEFGRVLAVANRDGSTLSAILRQAWDSGSLRVQTRKNPLQTTGAHISVVSAITAEELHRRLTDTEIVNGFVNRYLLCCVRRSKKLPHGGNLDPAALDGLVKRITAAADHAAEIDLMARSPDANRRWELAYDAFPDHGGLVGAVTARADAQTLRLSVAYALLDGSKVIELPHLEAALAVWRYCEASARYLFGDATGDPVADRLFEAILAAGEAGLDASAQRDLFSRHVAATRLAQARDALERQGLIVTTREPTAGRDRLVSRAVQP